MSTVFMVHPVATRIILDHTSGSWLERAIGITRDVVTILSAGDGVFVFIRPLRGQVWRCCAIWFCSDGETARTEVGGSLDLIVTCSSRA